MSRPPAPPSKLAPPPGEGARFDAFERETLQSLNHSLRGVLTLGNEQNRSLHKLADVLGQMHESGIALRELTQQAIAATQQSITEQQLTREVIRELRDEIAMWRAERKVASKPAPAERTESTAVRPRPVRKVAG